MHPLLPVKAMRERAHSTEARGAQRRRHACLRVDGIDGGRGDWRFSRTGDVVGFRLEVLTSTALRGTRPWNCGRSPHHFLERQAEALSHA